MKNIISLLFCCSLFLSAFASDEVIRKEDLGSFKSGGEHKLVLSRKGDVFRANLFTAEPIKLKLYKTRPFHHVMTFYVCHEFNQVADVISYEINTPQIGFASVNFRCKDGYPTKWRKRAADFCAKAEEHMGKTCKLVTEKYGDDVFK